MEIIVYQKKSATFSLLHWFVMLLLWFIFASHFPQIYSSFHKVIAIIYGKDNAVWEAILYLCVCVCVCGRKWKLMALINKFTSKGFPSLTPCSRVFLHLFSHFTFLLYLSITIDLLREVKLWKTYKNFKYFDLSLQLYLPSHILLLSFLYSV